MRLTTSLAQLRALNPCSEGITFANVALPAGEFTAREARAAGVSFDDIVWAIAALARQDPAWDARLQRWLDECAAHVRVFAGGEYPLAQRESDERARARDFEQQRLDAAVRAITRYAGRRGFAAGSRAANAAAKAGALSAAMSGRSAVLAARASAETAFERAKQDGIAREEAWQFDRLVERFDDPEPRAVRLL
jgi:hypothetical protein